MLGLALHPQRGDHTLPIELLHGTNKSLPHVSQPRVGNPEMLRMPEVLATLQLIVSTQQGTAGPSEATINGLWHSPLPKAYEYGMEVAVWSLPQQSLQ